MAAAARDAFVAGMGTGATVAAAVAFAGALVALRFLPARQARRDSQPTAGLEAARA